MATLKLVTCAVVLLACSGGGGGDARRADALPDTISAVVTAAHGREETIRLYRFVAPEKWPVQFSTYVPVGMTANVAPPSGEESVSFDLRKGAATDQDPFVHIYFYPEGTTEHRARVQVEAFAASRGVPLSEQESTAAPRSEEGIPPEAGTVATRQFEWALDEIPYAYGCVASATSCAIGRIALGQVNGRFFHMVIQYPPSVATWFLPRAHHILHHWKWHR